MAGKKEFKETVLKEFDPIRKGYKSRLVKNDENGKVALDVREYVESDKFTGFTRSGLRLDKESLQKAVQVYTEAIAAIEEIEKGAA